MALGFGFGFPRRRPGAALWTPAMISTALWLDAADASTVTLNGSTVSQWNDKSGNGRNAVQATAANQPGWGVGRNLLRYSEQMNAGAPFWITTLTITPDVAIAPDGTLTADRFDSALSSVYQTFTSTPNTAYTFSFYVRLGTLSASDFVFAVRDDTAGVFIGIDIVPSVALSSSSWARVTYTFTTPAGCVLCRVYPFRNKIPGGDGTFFIWGAQVNQGTTADPYQQTTSVAQPLLAGINGKASLAFDGNDFIAGTWSPATASQATVALVCSYGVSTTTSAAASIGTSSANSGLGLGWNTTSTRYTSFLWGVGEGFSSAAFTSNPVIQIGVLSNTAVAQSLNGVLNQSGLGSPATITTAYQIGAINGALPLSANSRVAEVVMMNVPASTENRQLLEGYLAWKWGLQGSLPAGHPYRFIPPTV